MCPTAQLDPSVALHVSHHDVELAVRIPGFKRVGGLLLSELATLQIPLVQAELADAKVTSTPPPRRYITAVNIVWVLPVVVCVRATCDAMHVGLQLMVNIVLTYLLFAWPSSTVVDCGAH